MRDDPEADSAAEPDEGLAAKVADAAVRRALVESQRQLLGFLQRRLGSVEEAEVVLQAFALRAIEQSVPLRSGRTVRGRRSRVLATTIADHQRRSVRQRQRETVTSPGAFEDFTIEPDVELDEAVCNCLYQLLPTLEPDVAEVIRRVDLLGEPRDRAAASLGVTLNSVAERLHRGRQALKRRLVEMCLTCPVHGFLDCRCEAAERVRRQREELGGVPQL